LLEFLFGLHSGVRYLVLIAALVALALTAANWQRRGALANAERMSMGAFVGLLDLQVVIGVILLLMWPFYPALIGHIAMMVLAAGAAHGGSIMARRRDPAGSAVRLATIVIVLVLLVGGIMAIQRSVI
jgi:hypothetical protein